MQIRKLALDLAAVILAPLALLSAGGCSFEIKGRLLDPLNRTVSGNTESAMVARARHLLAGGLTEAEVIQNLVAQGQTEDEARRIVALAVKGK